MNTLKALLGWAAFGGVIVVPIAVAATSPLLQWRDPVYIASGFAGILAMVLLVVQPLLVGGYLPGVPRRSGRYLHRWTGGLLVAAVLLHVAGLWRTSPPDMIDALLFVSPTPFSPWGVIAMWAIFAAAVLAVFRLRGSLRLRTWRLAHSGLVLAAVLASVLHALLIEGTMGPLSKALLCALAVAAIAKVLFDLRVWTVLTGAKG